MKKIIIILLLGWSHFTLAQNLVSFYGVVNDSTQRPVEFANVVAYDVMSDQMVSYGITDAEGRFHLKLEIEKEYALKFTYVGYHNKAVKITASANEKEPIRVILKENIVELEAVTIEEEFPVMISGDTISYKADAFTKGNERKLEDVLEAIPGFDVDENGQVRVQGKQVEKVLVDGKEFFEGDTKLAVQNIPANAVDRVQVLRNFSDITPMSGLGNNDDRLAINIALADDKKNMTFGDLEAGAGLDQRYLGHVNLFRYTPKSTLNFIGDLNNIGKQAFTPRDYFRFAGGMRNMMSQSGSNFSRTDDTMGFMNLQNNSALEIDTKLGALNFNLLPEKKWNLSGFAIASTSETDLFSVSNRSYVNSLEGNNEEILTTEENQQNLSGLAKFKARYTPNSDTQMEYEFFVKGGRLDGGTTMESNNLGGQNNIITEAAQTPVNINQGIDVYHALNESHIFSLELNYEYDRSNPFRNFLSSNQIFANQLPIEGQSSFLFSQDKNIATHKYEAVANWYYVVNKTNHINFRIGNTYSDQLMYSGINQNNNVTLDASTYVNDFDYQFHDLYAGINLRSKIGKFILNPGIYRHSYRTRNTQTDTSPEIDKILWLPEFIVQYDIQSSQSLRFRYNKQANFMDIQKVAQGLTVQNYNNLYLGNPNIQNSINHNFDLNYSNYSLFSHFSIFGGLNYRKIYSNLRENILYQGLERMITPINVNAPNDLFSFYSDIEKTFKKFKISGSSNLFYSKSTNRVNDILNQNKSFTQQYEFTIDTKFIDFLVFAAGYERSYNRYSGSTVSNDYIKDRPFANIQISVTKWLTLSADYEYNNYRAEDGSSRSTYDFLNASVLIQKEKSPWLFSLNGTNLLNTDIIRQDGFSDNLISTYAYYIQPRYLTFSLKYEF